MNYEQARLDSALGFGWSEDPFTRVLVTDNTGDIGASGGLTNFGNAIYRRLKTPLGWFPEFPFYGCRLNEMIGMGNTYENRMLIETWIEESLLYEYRIINGSLKISVEKDSSDYRAVIINIQCRIKDMPDPAVFVYSFFLKSGDLAQAT